MTITIQYTNPQQPVWVSPDGKRKIYTVVDQRGNHYKTYSHKLGSAEPGTTFEVEAYEKDQDVFVRQQQETQQPHNQTPQATPQQPQPTPQPAQTPRQPAQPTQTGRDDTNISIERQTAVKAAVEAANGLLPLQNKEPSADLHVQNILFFADRLQEFIKKGESMENPVVPASDDGLEYLDENLHGPDPEPNYG